MGPLFFITDATNELEWAQPELLLWQMLSMSLNGPINFMEGASNTNEWAHLYFIVGAGVLPISFNGPIYFYGRCCQYA